MTKLLSGTTGFSFVLATSSASHDIHKLLSCLMLEVAPVGLGLSGEVGGDMLVIQHQQAAFAMHVPCHSAFGIRC